MRGPRNGLSIRRGQWAVPAHGICTVSAPADPPLRNCRSQINLYNFTHCRKKCCKFRLLHVPAGKSQRIQMKFPARVPRKVGNYFVAHQLPSSWPTETGKLMKVGADGQRDGEKEREIRYSGLRLSN